MRYLSRYGLTLVAALTLALCGPLADRGTLAQDATPGTDAGFSVETLALGTGNELPVAPAILLLERLTVPPGMTIPGEPGDPAVVFFYLEAGELTIVADGPLPVTRAAALAASPGALPELEQVPAGTEFTLQAGDSLVFPPLVGVELRNASTAPAVIVATLILSAADLGVDLGTPTP